MKPLKFTLLLITGLLLNSQLTFSQKFLDMMDDPNANFYDVQKEANLYFQTFFTKEKLEKEKKAGIENEEEGGLYNLYKRWEANMQHYIDEKGNRISTVQIDQIREAFKSDNNSVSQNSKIQAHSWKELGPWNWNYTSSWAPGLGRLQAIQVDGKNQNIIYVGSPEGGAWKTTNGGASWNPLTDFINSSALTVWAIGMADGSPDTVYIGNGAGIFYSYNGGQTLTNVSVAGIVRKIVVNPKNHLIVLAATTSGLFRSTNAGKTWTSVRTGAFYDLKLKPGDPNTVYAVGTGFVKSINGGLTFNTITVGTTGEKRVCLESPLMVTNKGRMLYKT